MLINQKKIFPILSSADPFLKKEMVPETYPETIFGPLGSLQNELYWHFYDLCYFHQLAYGDINQKLSELDKEYELFKENIDKVKDNPDIDNDELNAYYAKKQSMFMDYDLALYRAKRFADEYSIIGLWAMTERFLGNVYAHIISDQTGVAKESVHKPYKWDDLKTKFLALGIDLASINGFMHADECRALNNSIKHSQMVDAKLSIFPFFQNNIDKPLQCIELEMQRYATEIYNFCSGSIAAGARLILGIQTNGLDIET